MLGTKHRWLQCATPCAVVALLAACVPCVWVTALACDNPTPKFPCIPLYRTRTARTERCGPTQHATPINRTPPPLCKPAHHTSAFFNGEKNVKIISQNVTNWCRNQRWGKNAL